MNRVGINLHGGGIGNRARAPPDTRFHFSNSHRFDTRTSMTTSPNNWNFNKDFSYQFSTVKNSASVLQFVVSRESYRFTWYRSFSRLIATNRVSTQ